MTENLHLAKLQKAHFLDRKNAQVLFEKFMICKSIYIYNENQKSKPTREKGFGKKCPGSKNKRRLGQKE
jgi:hypothetical protein